MLTSFIRKDCSGTGDLHAISPPMTNTWLNTEGASGLSLKESLNSAVNTPYLPCLKANSPSFLHTHLEGKPHGIPLFPRRKLQGNGHQRGGLLRLALGNRVNDGDRNGWRKMLPCQSNISQGRLYRERLRTAKADPDRNEPCVLSGK